jgi:hypothetical protein
MNGYLGRTNSRTAGRWLLQVPKLACFACPNPTSLLGNLRRNSINGPPPADLGRLFLQRQLAAQRPERSKPATPRRGLQRIQPSQPGSAARTPRSVQRPGCPNQWSWPDRDDDNTVPSDSARNQVGLVTNWVQMMDSPEVNPLTSSMLYAMK